MLTGPLSKMSSGGGPIFLIRSWLSLSMIRIVSRAYLRVGAVCLAVVILLAKALISSSDARVSGNVVFKTCG